MVRRGAEKKGQVTIFVIIAIVIVVAAASYFIFKDTLFPTKVSTTFEPIETNFLNCIQEKALVGIKILESKGGYIENPDFIPGSQYMPFSSQLDFLGVGIPYWRSISGNNIPIDQVPTKSEIQNQLQDYLNSEIQNCKFNSFSSEGFQIIKGKTNSEVSVNNNFVKVFVDMDLKMTKGNETQTITNHQVEVNSELGNLYDDALEFYNKEKSENFLENYSVDILRNYAPVDGVELTCAPKVWNADEIFSTLKDATEANFFALKNSGEKTDYFNLKLPIDSGLRILNSKDWPNTYEVAPANSQTLVAKPVGTQKGLGILGFCYVPYHFVYNVKYPVLVQLTRNDEIFQFPLSIVIERNLPKGAANENASSSNSVNLCTGPYSNITLELINSDGNKVNGNVSFDCLGSSCPVGETQGGVLSSAFPQCANGKVVVSSPGYEKSSQVFSTVNGGSLTVVMNKEYEKTVDLNVTNGNSNERAIISFETDSGINTLVYPEKNKINLSAGTYTIKVYVYDNSSITFPANTIHQCARIASGLGGLLGFTHEKCTDTKVPAQNLTNVLIAGGTQNVTFLDSELSSDKGLEISLERYNTPKSLQELQIVYTLVDAKTLGVSFK